MAPDPDVPPGPDARRAAYETARDNADAAEEAVGDAEDDLADAERTLGEDDPAGGGEQRAAHQEEVRVAEDAWHDRRHEAYTASQERDRAREELGDEGPFLRATGGSPGPRSMGPPGFEPGRDGL